jgi:hypothetical protein
LTSLNDLSAEYINSLRERLEAKLTPEPMTGCWLWSGAHNTLGYGNIGVDGHVRAAHRIAWLLSFGSVPDELVLDHKCRQPACCNINHLEPVTGSENNLRGLQGVLRTLCPSGHDLTASTSKTPQGRCRACNNAAQRKWKAKRREQLTLGEAHP